MWKQFGHVIDALPDECWEEAIGAAVATFESINTWICGTTPEPSFA
jgi:hypothetical protein